MLNVRTILSILHVNRRSSSLRPTTSAQVKMRSILVTIPALALSAPGSGVLGFVSPIGGLSGRVALSSPNCARTSPLRSSKRARAREAVSMAVGAIVGAGRIGCALNVSDVYSATCCSAASQRASLNVDVHVKKWKVLSSTQARKRSTKEQEWKHAHRTND